MEPYRRIIAADRIPRSCLPEVREALNITRWLDPTNHSEHELGSLSMREAHIACAFSCACLLCVCITDETEEPEDCIPQLIESCYAVDKSLIHEALHLIEWVEGVMVPSSHQTDQIVYDYVVICACARLVLYSMLGEQRAPIREYAELIIESGPRIVVGIHPITGPEKLQPDGNWIHDEVLRHCTARESWSRLAQRWLLQPPRNLAPDVQQLLVTIGRLCQPAE